MNEDAIDNGRYLKVEDEDKDIISFIILFLSVYRPESNVREYIEVALTRKRMWLKRIFIDLRLSNKKNLGATNGTTKKCYQSG